MASGKSPSVRSWWQVASHPVYGPGDEKGRSTLELSEPTPAMDSRIVPNNILKDLFRGMGFPTMQEPVEKKLLNDNHSGVGRMATTPSGFQGFMATLQPNATEEAFFRSPTLIEA